MTAPLFFRRAAGGLVPTDDRTRKAMEKWPWKEVLCVDVRRPRNGKFHRGYWAFLARVHENLPEHLTIPTVEDLHRSIKIALGYSRVVTDLNGVPRLDVDSTSYESMNQDEFAEFVEQAVEVIRVAFWPDMPPGDLFAVLNEEMEEREEYERIA